VLTEAGSGSGDFIGLIYSGLLSPQHFGTLCTFIYLCLQPACAFIFDNTYYVPVESTAALKNISIEIIKLTGKPFESSDTPSRLALYFRRNCVWD
jgi:hypothetical protein